MATETIFSLIDTERDDTGEKVVSKSFSNSQDIWMHYNSK